jgi:hypothetical protein
VLSLSRGLRSRSPLPTPGGHAGVRSTSSTLPQAVSNTVPMSRATPTTVHRNHEKMKRCFTPPYYDVNSHLPRRRRKSPCHGAREQDADKLRCGRRSATVSASYRYSAFRVERAWCILSRGSGSLRAFLKPRLAQRAIRPFVPTALEALGRLSRRSDAGLEVHVRTALQSPPCLRILARYYTRRHGLTRDFPYTTQ